MSYGCNGEEETSKTTPMGGYMVDIKNRKSLQAEKGENRMYAQFMNYTFIHIVDIIKN